jgi:hypothetical protein
VSSRTLRATQRNAVSKKKKKKKKKRKRKRKRKLKLWESIGNCYVPIDHRLKDR